MMLSNIKKYKYIYVYDKIKNLIHRHYSLLKNTHTPKFIFMIKLKNTNIQT